jgi:hypothetical protein
MRLTQQVKAGGCASKLAAGSLRTVLDGLPQQSDANLPVGFDQSDDAGVYEIGDDVAWVQTVDFFTPMVGDAFTFGRIAAANALSDVYAMGGRVLTALAIVCYPQDGDLDVLGQVMRGGLGKMAEANCTIVGGHSVRDPEMKFGYAVIGLIDPARVRKNAGARPEGSLFGLCDRVQHLRTAKAPTSYRGHTPYRRQDMTEPMPIARSYRWGMFQGWSTAAVGFVIYLSGPFLNGLSHIVAEYVTGFVMMATDIGLVGKRRFGFILFLVSCAFALHGLFFDPPLRPRVYWMVAIWWVMPGIRY